MSDFIPAEGFCVGEYIRDELEERGWTTRDCAERMGGDVRVNELTLELHIACIDAPLDHAIHRAKLNPETAAGLGRAFGTDAQGWLNLDAAYRRWYEYKMRAGQ